MGVSKDEQMNRKAAGPAAPKRAAYSGAESDHTVQGLDWGVVDPAILQRAVSAVTAAGDAISLARGARGRWLSVTILADGNKYRDQGATVEYVEQILERVCDEAQLRT